MTLFSCDSVYSAFFFPAHHLSFHFNGNTHGLLNKTLQNPENLTVMPNYMCNTKQMHRLQQKLWICFCMGISDIFWFKVWLETQWAYLDFGLLLQKSLHPFCLGCFFCSSSWYNGEKSLYKCLKNTKENNSQIQFFLHSELTIAAGLSPTHGWD